MEIPTLFRQFSAYQYHCPEEGRGAPKPSCRKPHVGDRDILLSLITPILPSLITPVLFPHPAGSARPMQSPTSRRRPSARAAASPACLGCWTSMAARSPRESCSLAIRRQAALRLGSCNPDGVMMPC